MDVVMIGAVIAGMLAGLLTVSLWINENLIKMVKQLKRANDREEARDRAKGVDPPVKNG